MKILCVAEKPSIAKSISQILSSGSVRNREGRDKYCRNYDFQYRLPGYEGMVDITMTSVRGHLTGIDFPEQYAKWSSCDPAVLFDAPITTSVTQDGIKIGLNIRNEARAASAVMIWTDCDREGEHIGSEIVQECRKVNRHISVMRARFSAIIANQIHHACQNTVELDWLSASAVEARSELDLRVGAAFTRLQTMGLRNRISELNDAKSMISYGPCQFPTLGFVVDRYNKVTQFDSEPFWYISVTKDRTVDGRDPSPDDPRQDIKTVVFSWDRGHLFDLPTVQILYEFCTEQNEALVKKVKSKQTKKWKPYPLTTVELQKAGSRVLRLAPKKTLDIAESLYQKGLLSYPRTETDQYDKDFDFQSLITKQTSDPQWGPIATRLIEGEYERPRDGRNNDKAHPPIHPTAHANNLTGDDKRVYDYVTRRFLGSCWKDAIGRQTTVEIEIAQETFRASGLVIHERNFLQVCTYEKWEGNVLPVFHEGETFLPTTCNIKKGKTSPPKFLTEADLVSLMDKNGIGTDATIAEHIAKVIDRSYVMKVKEGKITYLVPSTLGIGLVEGYNKINFEKSLSKPLLRRETEFRMSLICAGQRTKQETIAESIEEYRAVYSMVNREFDSIVQTVTRYLRDPNAGQEARAVALAEADGEEEDHGNDDDDDDDGPFGPPADQLASTNNDRRTSTRGRGRGRGRGGGGRALPPVTRTTATTTVQGRGRGRGRGRDTTRATSRRDDSTDDSDADDINTSGARGTASFARTNPPRSNPTPSSNNSNNNTPKCECGDDAVERTVAKEGPNKGRKFWCCTKFSDAGRCSFFEWSDSPPSGGSSTAMQRTTAQTSNSVVPQKRTQAVEMEGSWAVRYRARVNSGSDDDAPPRCDCNLETKLCTVNKEGPNKGRQFYACSRELVRLKCKFFEWNDDTRSEGIDGRNSNANPPKGTCYHCGQEGHWANNCPNPDRSSSSRRNVTSRNGGTMNNSSNNNRSHNNNNNSSNGRGGEASNSRGQDQCFKCGGKGHWSSACPNQ